MNKFKLKMVTCYICLIVNRGNFSLLFGIFIDISQGKTRFQLFPTDVVYETKKKSQFNKYYLFFILIFTMNF